MCKEEYQKMVSTGKIQLAPETDLSFVSYPPSPTSFKGKKPGSVYVEFDMDSSYLRQGENWDWKQVIGPSSRPSVREQKIGRSNITDIPEVFNIKRLDNEK